MAALEQPQCLVLLTSTGSDRTPRRSPGARRKRRLRVEPSSLPFAARDEGEPAALLEARFQEWKQHKGSERDRTACGVLDENTALGKLVVEDFAQARVLDRMLMCERRIESSLYRTMASSQGEDHRQTSSSLPPGVEEGPLSTSGDLAATSCQTKPIRRALQV